MIRMQWNSLRPGHRVLVHDDDDPDMALLPGRVSTIVDGPGSNDVAITVASGGRAVVIHPTRMSVHLDPLDIGERCWRCRHHDFTVERRRRDAPPA